MPWLVSAAVLLLLAACAPAEPELRAINAEQWPIELSKLNDGPLLVYVWATWRPESVEMLPSVIEQGLANQGRGLRIATICLDDPLDDSGVAEAGRLILKFPASVPHFLLQSGLDHSLALFGINDTPAVLVYTSRGELLHRLEAMEERQPLSIADVADAIDTALPASATGT